MAKALASSFPNSRIVKREVFHNWGSDSGVKEIEKYFSSLDEHVIRVFNCAGITNTSSNPIHLQDLNFKMPRNLLTYCNGKDMQVVTFGSVMENFAKYSETNNYLKSKISLRNWIVENFNTSKFSLHLQMHTLYGGMRVQQHMFLGQIIESIRRQELFRMSAGNQIREYHHIDDDVAALKILLSQSKSGIQSISHGSPIKLSDLAQYIFSTFGIEDLLSIGQLESSNYENQDVVFEPNIDFTPVNFRETKVGVVNWIRGVLDEK